MVGPCCRLEGVASQPAPCQALWVAAVAVVVVAGSVLVLVVGLGCFKRHQLSRRCLRWRRSRGHCACERWVLAISLSQPTWHQVQVSVNNIIRCVLVCGSHSLRYPSLHTGTIRSVVLEAGLYFGGRLLQDTLVATDQGANGAPAPLARSTRFSGTWMECGCKMSHIPPVRCDSTSGY